MTPFKALSIQIITLSDRASRGEYEDLSGPKIEEMLSHHFSETKWQIHIERTIIPDDANELSNILLQAIAQKVDIVFTTGGTGVGKRDITPEVAKQLINKEIPGIMENIRIKYGQKIPNALLSRGIAGVTNQTQIYTLPGSVKAVKEYIYEILKTLEHLVFMIHSIDIHTAPKDLAKE